MGDGNKGQRVVLVTGVTGYWGARVAARLWLPLNTVRLAVQGKKLVRV